MRFGVLSLGVLSINANAQIPKVFDASVPRAQQIALAMTAAPAEVSSRATVYVLGRGGYEKVRDGSNGFSCMVFRSFVNPSETTVGPMCFDAEGSRTVMVAWMRGEELRSQGKSEDEIKTELDVEHKDGRLHHPTKIGILYMLSPYNRIGPTKDHTTVHEPPHVMLYAPNMTNQDLGFDSAPQSDFMGLTHAGTPDNLLVLVPAQH